MKTFWAILAFLLPAMAQKFAATFESSDIWWTWQTFGIYVVAAFVHSFILDAYATQKYRG